jgi:DNA-binding CsgD family transcriptional regulator
MHLKDFNHFLASVRKYDTADYLKSKSGVDALTSVLDFFPYKSLAPAMFVLDYTTGSYLNASNGFKEISGYNREEFLKAGVALSHKLYDGKYTETFNKKILRNNMLFFMSQSRAKQSTYKSLYNYGIFDKKGNFKNLRQESIIIHSAETGEPLVTVGTIYDITSRRYNNIVRHQIHALDTNNIVVDDEYNIALTDMPLSSYEIKVLHYIYEGKTDKEIADKLYRTVDTVKYHKKNIYEKTNSKNAIDAIRFAIENGYL